MPRRRRQPNLQPALNAFLRLPMKQQVVIALVAVLILGAVAIWSRQATEPVEPPRPQVVAPSSSGKASLLLGNPSQATTDPANRDNFLLVKPFYALSYNNTHGTANWVAWRVTTADLGNAPRPRGFSIDPDLPRGFKLVTHEDYSGSGFDRGHLIPHGDRDAMPVTAQSTFVTTNIIPQAPNVNQKAWARFENHSRDLVRQGQRLYQIAGPLGSGGVGTNGPAKTIANGKVTVPAFCWKIALIVPETGQENDLSQITARSRVIALVMPNDNAQTREDWKPFRVSVEQVERRTGLRFFDQLDPAIAAELKRKVDTE